MDSERFGISCCVRRQSSTDLSWASVKPIKSLFGNCRGRPTGLLQNLYSTYMILTYRSPRYTLKNGPNKSSHLLSALTISVPGEHRGYPIRYHRPCVHACICFRSGIGRFCIWPVEGFG